MSNCCSMSPLGGMVQLSVHITNSIVITSQLSKIGSYFGAHCELYCHNKQTFIK